MENNMPEQVNEEQVNEEQVFIASAPVASLLGPDLKLKTTMFLVENLLHFNELQKLNDQIKERRKRDKIARKNKKK